MWEESQRRTQRRRAGEREKEIHKPSAQAQPPLISHDKEGYRARLEGCVCVSVCACLQPSTTHLLVMHLKKKQEREIVSKIVETLMCPPTNQKGQSCFLFVF